MSRFKILFGKKHSVIAMVHVDALPGTPRHQKSMDEIVSKACRETETYLRHNVNGILIENMHDIPYVKPEYFQPETTACLTRICNEIKKILPENFPCGLQVLAGGNKEAIAIAHACSLNFIRAEGFVFGHVADEGYIDGSAGILLRYRKSIGADDVLVLTDIKKKHSSHAITNDISVAETAKAAEFFQSDGIILTGTSTGAPTDTRDLIDVKKSCSLPILIGSGTNADSLKTYSAADAFIIGSYFKKDGLWMNELDEIRIREVTEKVAELQ